MSITIDDSGFRAKLGTMLEAAKRPRAILVAMGGEARRLLVAHFRAKNSAEPNKLGGKRTNFWNQIAGSTQRPEANEAAREVTISITDARLNQKIHGGTITAKRAAFLTIPIHPEAHGRSASVLASEKSITLFPVTSKNGGLLLGAVINKEFTPFYVLKKSVTQNADPTALPDFSASGDFVTKVAAAGQSALDRQLQAK